MDADVDVHPPRPTRLGPPAQSDLLQQTLCLHRDTAHIVPLHTWSGIEVDAQLIGMVEIARADRMWVKLDASQVHDPREARRIVHNDLLGGPPRGKRQGDG